MESQSAIVLQNQGFCCVCEAETTFIARHPWLRDHYRCVGCQTAPRDRALVEILTLMAHDWRQLQLHESSPAGDHISRKCPGYTCSHLFEDTPLGSMKNGISCENLECMLTHPLIPLPREICRTARC